MPDIFERLNNEINIFTVLQEESKKAAKEEGFTEKYEIDAFRHTYSSAVVAQKYGVGVGRAGGFAVEVGGALRNAKNIITGEDYDSAIKVVEESTMDFLNNESGFKIGQEQTSEEGIRQAVSQGIRDKTLVVEPNVVRNSLENIEYKYERIITDISIKSEELQEALIADAVMEKFLDKLERIEGDKMFKDPKEKATQQEQQQ